MDHLAPSNVPLYTTSDERDAIWEQCVELGQPVVALRDGTRGYVVKYDLQHLDRQLTPEAVQQLRDRVRSQRPYPTETDPVSETEGLGGEAGPVSADLHAPTEQAGRELAAHVGRFVFDRDNWQTV